MLNKNILLILFVILLNLFFRLIQIVFFNDLSFISDSIYTSIYKIFLIYVIFRFSDNISIFKNRISFYIFITVILINSLISYYYLIYYGVLNLFLHFLRCFNVALFEELIFRVLVFYNFIFYFKNKKYENFYIFKSIIYTSLCFSLIHIVNFLFGRYDILSTIIQIEIALLFGVFLQYIFLKYKSIILISLIHCFFNYYGSINRIFHSNNTKIEPVVLDYYSFKNNQIILVPLIIITFTYIYIVFKKKYNKPNTSSL